MRVALASLSALSVMAFMSPALAAGPWTPGLQPKTCFKAEWLPKNPANPAAGSNLNIYNTDGSTLLLSGNGSQTPPVPDALTPAQAVMLAACSPNIKAPQGHTYWAVPVVGVNNSIQPTPSPSRIVITYPPSNQPPVFQMPPPNGLWTAGIQTKTCVAIDWFVGNSFFGQPETLVLHNSDGSALKLPGAVTGTGWHVAYYAETLMQATAIEACGPNAAISGDGRQYRATVNDLNSPTPTPVRLLFKPPQQ